MSYRKKFMAARLNDPVRPELINRMFSSIEEEFRLISKGIAVTDRKVAVDAVATPDYLGALSSDGVLRVNAPLTYADGGNFVTLDIDEALIDHGLLGGLEGDDHALYHTDARGDARYYTKTLLDGGQLDTRYYTEGEIDALLAAQDAFLELLDTPGSYADQAGKFVKVNATPDGLEFADILAGDLPSHNHIRSNITDFFDSPFWASIPDKPSTYPPSSHDHVKADITDTPWAWADVLKIGANLTDLPTRSHADLQSVSSDQHHPQSHALASHSTKAHSELTGVTSDLHHPQSHVLDGAYHSISGKTPGHFLKALTATTFGFAAHGLNYSDVGAAPTSHNHVRSNITDFWNEAFWASIPDKPSTFTPSVHASSHHVGGGDLVNHDNLTGFVAAEHKSLPNAIAQVLSDHDKSIHDALGINADTLDTLHASSLALITRKLDDFGTPDDNTDLNASTTRHGLLRKLGGGTANFLRADGTWASPGGGWSCAARAYRSAAMAVQTATYSKIQFDVENYDLGGNFANFKFTAPANGYYLITATVGLDLVADGKRFFIFIYIDGSRWAQRGIHTGRAQEIYADITSIEYLTAGREVEIYVWHDHGAARDVRTGRDKTWICVTRLDG